MADKPRHDADFVTVDEKGNKTLNLHVLFKVLIQQGMGRAIDYARMSGMADRSFNQFERLTKDDFYKLMEYASRILTEYGYKDTSEKK